MSTDQNELFAPASGTELESALSALSDGERADLKARWPKSLAEMADVVAVAVSRHAGKDVAARMADDIVLALAHHMGGRMFYLPRDERLRTALRNRRLWQDYKNNNIQELALAYKLTEVQVYNIIRDQRALHRKKIQGTLF